MKIRTAAKAYTAGATFVIVQLAAWLLAEYAGIVIPLEIQTALGAVLAWLAVFFVPNKREV